LYSQADSDAAVGRRISEPAVHPASGRRPDGSDLAQPLEYVN